MTKSYDWGLYDNSKKDSVINNATSIFTPKECDIINNYGLYHNDLKDGSVRYGDIDHSVRNSKIVFLSSNDEEIHWVYRRVTDAILLINKEFYEYDLDKIEVLQFTSYDYQSKGFYRPHVDSRAMGSLCRKLSFSIQLSSEDSYAGGDLLFNFGGGKRTASKEQGIGLFFPSWVLHEVTPVRTGIRNSLVGWVLGPHFK